MFFQRLLKYIGLSKETKKEPYFFLTNLLGFEPGNIQLYTLALRHKSTTIKDRKGHVQNNERLEYLGDAIMEAIVSDLLYHQFPEKEEGYLTSLRSKIVQRETLNKVALKMELDKVVRLPIATHSHNLNIYGNALEALVGAIYLDKGYAQTTTFFKEIVLKKYIDINSLSVIEQNFKSRLIEWGHKYKARIEFITIEGKKDRDNNILFHSKAMVNDVCIGEGEGYSKRSSHQDASEKALQTINNDKELIQNILMGTHIS